MSIISTSTNYSNADRVDTNAEFLHAIHGDARGYSCIWAKPRGGGPEANPVSRFFENTTSGRTDAASYAISLADRHDIYFSCALLAHPLPGGRRGKAEDVIAIGSLWADVDFGPGHKSGNVPPDEATALRILDRVSPPPSIIVHSGGGLHAYWVLEAPLTFTDPQDREHAHHVVMAWQAVVRRAFAAAGFSIDKTDDLARVLRVPETFNFKQAEPRPVRILRPC